MGKCISREISKERQLCKLKYDNSSWEATTSSSSLCDHQNLSWTNLSNKSLNSNTKKRRPTVHYTKHEQTINVKIFAADAVQVGNNTSLQNKSRIRQTSSIADDRGNLEIAERSKDKNAEFNTSNERQHFGSVKEQVDTQRHNDTEWLQSILCVDLDERNLIVSSFFNKLLDDSVTATEKAKILERLDDSLYKDYRNVIHKINVYAKTIKTTEEGIKALNDYSPFPKLDTSG